MRGALAGEEAAARALPNMREAAGGRALPLSVPNLP